MLYFLGQLGDSLTAFNVFRYITFRTAGAVITALFFVFLFGPGMIAMLRLKQGRGQPIREARGFGKSVGCDIAHDEFRCRCHGDSVPG